MHIALATGQSQFLELFGKLTVADIVTAVMAIVFLIIIYRRVSKLITDKHDRDVERDKQLVEALTGVRKYPEYRQQSINIQHELQNEIAEIRQQSIETQRELKAELEKLSDRLEKMENTANRRACNELRDTLLQSYRYYTSTERNPSQSWTRMEAEAFWGLFGDYEEAGGDGYMHTTVQPAMNKLTIIEMEDFHGHI